MHNIVGVVACPSEPTVLCGVTSKSNSGTVILVYVDDLIIESEKPEGIAEVREAISAKVKVKITGSFGNSMTEGGALVFLCKTIRRPPYSNEVMHLRSGT